MSYMLKQVVILEINTRKQYQSACEKASSVLFSDLVNIVCTNVTAQLLM